MKKQIYTTLICVAALFAFACNTTTSEWTLEQRKSVRRLLHQYRDMTYIEELTDAEFYIFSDNVIDEMEVAYPDYDTLFAFPAVSDSIESYVTTVIIEQLDADASNMQHIYPYRTLVKEGVLPKALTRQQQRAFYKCFARKVNQQYSSFGALFEAVIYNTTNKSDIAKMQASCAKSLFDWTPADTEK